MNTLIKLIFLHSGMSLTIIATKYITIVLSVDSNIKIDYLLVNET